MPVQHAAFDVHNLVSTQAFQLAKLEAFLKALPESVVRAKGYVLLDTKVWCRFHLVASRLDVQFATDAPEHGQSRAVVFGRKLDKEAIAQAFFAAQTDSRLSTSMVR